MNLQQDVWAQTPETSVISRRSNWSTESTLGTCMGGDMEQNLSDGLEQTRHSTPTPRAFTTYRNMGILVCWTGVVTVFIVALIFVAIPIVMAGGQKANPARNKNVTDPSPNLPPSTDFSTRPSWHPVCDLQVTKQNPEGKDSILVLRDSLGPCSKVFVRNAGGSNNSTTTWNDLQPTVESNKSMGNLPHLWTGNAFLSIDHGFDLRQDQNWTLSFSGAQLSTADNSFDILFSAQGIGKIWYEANDNALGIYVRHSSAGWCPCVRAEKKKRETKKCGTGLCQLAGEEKVWRQCGTKVTGM
jgi:hypothetical protein